MSFEIGTDVGMKENPTHPNPPEKRIKLEQFATLHMEKSFKETMYGFVYTERQAGRTVDTESAYQQRYAEFKQ